MPIGNWTFVKSEDFGCYFIKRNEVIIAVASYANKDVDLDEEQIGICVQELIDLHELGKPYLEAMNPTMLDGV
jgi:hypothetical protein